MEWPLRTFYVICYGLKIARQLCVSVLDGWICKNTNGTFKTSMLPKRFSASTQRLTPSVHYLSVLNELSS
uniref:Secreted protein n=1 Tax=Ascaris lumbricoides TaxID=6252 RepID=A0A0M3I621_ASCLU